MRVRFAPTRTEMNGIAVAGSSLVDEINIIKEYPAMGRLTQVYGVNRSVGGLVPNVGVDIKRIAPDLSVYAYGKVGKDDKAEFCCFVNRFLRDFKKFSK